MGALFLVGVYSLTIPAPAYLVLDPALRLAIYNYRPYVWLAVVGLLAACLIVSKNLRSDDPASRRLLFLGLLFPVFYLLIGIAKSRLHVPTAALYFTWAVVSFGLAPAVGRDVASVRRFAGVFFWVSMTQWVGLAAVWAWLSEVPVHFRDRQAFGISNPNYYAQILQVALVTFILRALAGIAQESRRRLFVLVGKIVPLSVGVVTGVVFAQSRNVMVFLVTVLALYLGLRKAIRGWLIPAVVGATIASTGLAGIALDDLHRWDSVSSRRISTWISVLDAAFWGDEPTVVLLVGPSGAPAGDVTRYDDLSEEKAFNKYRVDNFYLELFVESGAIGLMLFLLPYIALLSRAIARLKGGASEYESSVWAIALLGAVFVQGVFVATFPTFNSPLGMLMAWIAAWPLSLTGKRSVRAQGATRPSLPEPSMNPVRSSTAPCV